MFQHHGAYGKYRSRSPFQLDLGGAATSQGSHHTGQMSLNEQQVRTRLTKCVPEPRDPMGNTHVFHLHYMTQSSFFTCTRGYNNHCHATCAYCIVKILEWLNGFEEIEFSSVHQRLAHLLGLGKALSTCSTNEVGQDSGHEDDVSGYTTVNQ